MSIRAGAILHVSGRTVIQRIQAAGLGAIRIPINTIHEVGNAFVVDKVVQEPDFTFTMESLDVSTEIEALLHGEISATTASGAAAGQVDATGKAYDWSTVQPINIVSPWKDPATASAGTIIAGHLIPSYFPVRMTYKFGVTADAMQTVELAGGAFYYGGFAPLEQAYAGDGATKNFVTANAAVPTRIGGVTGTTFKSVFGVLVNGNYMTEGVDYTVTASPPGAPVPVTIQFVVAPPATDPLGNATVIRVAYFTSAVQAYPDSVHASAVVLPGAVRGRNIAVSIAPLGVDPTVAGNWTRLPRVQDVTVEGTYDTLIERELGQTDPVGRTINSFDTMGDFVIRAQDVPHFFSMLQTFTGLNTQQEIVGYINQNPCQLKVEIQNPRNPGAVLKTIYVQDAIFDMPGTPARANTATDFTLHFNAQTGDHVVFKGVIPAGFVPRPI